MKHYNYSIIIPHKNNVPLLARCLESIPKRDDVQIIVVDDNSDPAFIDSKCFPGKGRENVYIYFTKEGKGAGYARNVGLRYATGKWLLFADCDDTFETQVLDNVMTDCLISNVDIIFFNVNCIDAVTGKVSHVIDDQYKNYLTAKDDRENLCRYKIRVPWGKMVKKTIVDKNKILFSEVLVGNDFMFCLKIGYYAQSIQILSDVYIYNYYVGFPSLSTKGRSNIEWLKVHLDNAKERDSFVKSHGLQHYRSNHFYILPAIFRVNKLFALKTLVFCVKNTPFRYLFADIWEACRNYISR